MDNKFLEISLYNWNLFLSNLHSDYDIYAPKKFEDNLYFEFIEKSDIRNINYSDIGFRSVQPIKIFFLPIGETVSDTSKSVIDEKNKKKKLLVGLKACDLNALLILDEVYIDEDFMDPFYKNKRDNTVIISSDCTDPLDVCFCTEVDSKPYSTQNFDLNMSIVDEKSIVIEIGSQKGKNIIKNYGKELFKDASEEIVLKRDENRKKVEEKVKEINQKFRTDKSYNKVLEGSYESDLWEKFAEDCVECGGCTNICPTCHCFILVDGAKGEEFFKNKYWDSCQIDDFTKMAAGEDPRDEMWKRFRNRYFCKYNYKLDNFNIIACTGCGRCIEACQGGIDKREILREINKDEKKRKRKKHRGINI